MSAYPAQSDPTAVAGRRFGAFVIDSIVLAVIPLALFFATAGITLYERPTTCTQVAAKPGELSSSERCHKVDATVNDTEYSAATFKPAAAFLAGGVYLLYLILVEWIVQAMTGATLGKAIFGIRTVDEDGNAPGLGKQLIRGVLWIIDSLCSALVAAILILVTKGHRRLGDMAAKTFVVRAGAKGSPIIVPGMATVAVGAGAAGEPRRWAATEPPSTPPTGSYAPPAPGTMGTTPPMAAPAATAARAHPHTAASSRARGVGSAMGCRAQRLHPMGPSREPLAHLRRCRFGVEADRRRAAPATARLTAPCALAFLRSCVLGDIGRGHSRGLCHQIRKGLAVLGSAAVEQGHRTQSSFDVMFERPRGEVGHLVRRR